MQSEHYEVIHPAEPREGWLAARRSGIGASDAPALFGDSPYGSAFSVYASKLGLEDAETEADFLTVGREIEPVILRLFANPRYGPDPPREIRRGGGLMRSRRWPWMLATLDAWQIDRSDPSSPGVLEAKNRVFEAVDEGDLVLPRDVWIQVQHQLAVTGWTWGSVAWLEYGRRPRYADVGRDDDFIRDALVPRCEGFWTANVEAGIAPDPGIGNADATAAALKRIYPEAKAEKTVDLPAWANDDARRYPEILDAERALRAEKKAIRNRFLAAIGDAEYGRVPESGRIWSAKTIQRRGYTVEPTSYRDLRPTKEIQP